MKIHIQSLTAGGTYGTAAIQGFLSTTVHKAKLRKDEKKIPCVNFSEDSQFPSEKHSHNPWPPVQYLRFSSNILHSLALFFILFVFIPVV